TYLSQIGLYLLTTAAIADLSLKWPWRREILAFAAVMVIAGLAQQARIQASYWRNSETLWNHSLAVTSDNDFAHFALGQALLSQKRMDEAIPQFRLVLE